MRAEILKTSLPFVTGAHILNFNSLAPMAFTTETLFLGVAVALLVIYGSILHWRRQCSKYFNLPPGPRPLPIVGSLHLLGTNPHRSLAELASQYGPLMSVWLGQRLCIVASTAEAAKEFLKYQDANFAFRPTTRAAKIIAPGGIVLNELTPPIRHMRKILTTELMTTKQLESSQYIRKEEMAFMLHKIANENGPSCVRAHLTFMAINVLSRMIFNKRIPSVEEQDQGTKMIQEFVEITKEQTICLSAICIGDFFNIPKWFDPQPGLTKHCRNVRAWMDRFYKKVIDEYKEDQRKKPFKERKETLLDIFLEQLNFPENGVTEENISGAIYDLLGAGTDTTTVTVEWAMAEVLHNPTILTKATIELDRVVGLDHIVQESDLPHLKYLHAIIKETLRLHPPVPLLIPHENKVATKAFGYNIPAQTRLFVNAWAIGHNNNQWEKPLEFIPERFLEEGENVASDFRGQHFELLPFGSGRRLCPGMGLASIMVHLQVAILLHAFKWEAKDLELEEASLKITLKMQQPLAAIAKTRLPLHLYKG